MHNRGLINRLFFDRSLRFVEKGTSVVAFMVVLSVGVDAFAVLLPLFPFLLFLLLSFGFGLVVRSLLFLVTLFADIVLVVGVGVTRVTRVGLLLLLVRIFSMSSFFLERNADMLLNGPSSLFFSYCYYHHFFCCNLRFLIF